jgi:very-short-patch-repair endonuclease
VDGDIHKTQIEKDQEREAVFTQNGFRVIRFTNEQVENDIEKVLMGILDVVGDI